MTLAAIAALWLAGLVVLGLALWATPASGAFPGQNGLIAFSSFRDGNSEIYVMGPEGQNPTNLTNNAAHDTGPNFSPDGTKIAFLSDRDGNSEIYAMDADGQNPTRLTNNAASDSTSAFSPDGTKIAFTTNRDGNFEIYVMDADGQNPTNLTNNAANDQFPVFSPDGKIAFQSNRDGNQEVYVMDADGQNPTNLTNNPTQDGGGDFSPDGSRIVFQRAVGGNFDVYVMNADGQNQTNLTNDAASDDQLPVFSPDGTKIAFSACSSGSGCGSGNYEVYAMDADGQNPTNLTNHAAQDFAWDWGVAVPPETTIDSGPSGNTNDPTPSFSFSSSDSEASFECKVDSDPYSACSSPNTVAQLADGSHTFYVRAKDSFGIPDPTPDSRTFTVRTAEVSVVGSTIVVTAAAGAKDNLSITQPSDSTIRVTDVPNGPYTGSGVHAGPGCTRTGDYAVACDASGIALVQVTSRDKTDKVTNWAPVESSLHGGAADDVLMGGPGDDTLIGAPGADTFRGMQGDDELRARDMTSDTAINCDGGGEPGGADRAYLDLLPKDPNPVIGCETKTRS